MIMMWYSKLFNVLLSAVVLAASVGWCCSHNTGSDDAGQDMGGHAHHSAPGPQDLVAKTSLPAHHGADPSHTPDDDDPGCQNKIKMLSTNFDAGAVHTDDSGSYFQDAPAFVLPPYQMAWSVLSSRLPSEFKTPPDTFHGDSLRALSCLITI